ncbi:kinetochore Spc7 family protein [Haloferax volcanii]|uniref:Uncharacterized protein n=1 Tax=Haloferax volcanii TaxID=2246 RepID=A0A847TQJ5_HALVO|nr:MULTISPECIES: hypothetical protein [Haloferax]NLV02926.1 hypothetical protein [Haloferax alexandrinus]
MSEDRQEPESLAKEYLEAIDQEIDEDRRSELEDTKEELQDRREKYVSQHGEDSRIVQRVDQKIEDVETELDKLNESVQQIDELRTQLLKAAKDRLEFNREWLSTTVLEGLTHTLYAERDDYLILDQTRIEGPEDLDEIEDLVQLDMEHTFLLLVEDRLGETDTVSERWDRFVDSKYHKPFMVVSREGTASPEDVLPNLSEDADRKDAKNWLERPLYDWDDLVPYYRAGDGEFGLSTSGKYLAHHYAGSAESLAEEGDGGDDSDDGQTSLDDVGGNGGDSDE